MPHRWRSLHTAVTFLTCICIAGLAAAQVDRVPVPEVTGPIPVTANPPSYPFAAADHTMTPFDLASAGYLEEEFVVTGTANVYNWNPDRTLTVTTRATPYTTRLLVRRPRDARVFSGAVIVEPMYTPRRWDWPMMWGYLRDGLIARGDAWVGVTMPGANLAGLKRFHGARYASLSFANPTPAVPCPGTDNTSDIEDGLRWDALSQVAALLKTRGTAPLRGLQAGAVYLTVQGGDLTTYMNAIQPRAHLYDGFLARAPFNASRINRCATALAADDPRHKVHNVGVPVIAVAGEGDLVNTYAFRRADSDARADRYRLYEVAGAGHIDRFAYLGFPSLADQEAAGNAQGTVEWPFAAPCTPPVPLMTESVLRVAFDVALHALDGWARRGVAPKRAPRIETKRGSGTVAFTVVADQFGNARGGLRTTYVDVPTATYVTSSPGPGNCPEIGHVVPFDADRLKKLYGSFDGYAVRARRSIAALSAAGWLTRTDGAALTRELTDEGRARWRE